MRVKLYSPVDGEIINIENCKDSMFADRMLGDGFVVIPENGNFKAFFDKAKLTMIFDTKHAYGFKINDLEFLLHCGMDTVSLNGKGFKTKLEVGQTILKGDDLFEIDLNLLKEYKISSETPIVFEFNSLKEYKILNLKTGKVKAGDQVCTIEYKLHELKDEVNIQSDDDVIKFFNSENRYQKLAKELNILVGSRRNYNEVYNCMTRLRFSIKDKEKVNVDKIKSLNLVKGVVWNGNELQIVIGQEVYKVKDEVVNENNISNAIASNAGMARAKMSPSKKLFQMFAGIMTPMIPVILGTGMVQALMAILIQTGVMPDITYSSKVAEGQVWLFDPNLSIIWIVIFLTAKTTQIFMGILICVSAGKYFKYEGLMPIAIGLILCSPLAFFDGGDLQIGRDFVLFNFGTIHTGNPILDTITMVKVNMMGTKIFVIIAAVYTAKKLDLWIKSWINPIVDVMFRPTIVFVIVIPLAFFGYGIAWSYIEVLFGAAMFYVGKIPFGLGIGLYSASYQPAVVLGLHGPLLMISMLDSFSPANGGQTAFGMAPGIGLWATIGSLIGVIIITKNAKLKKQCVSMLPGGILGITEPIMYGLAVPKKSPLYSIVIASFIGGAVTAVFGVTARGSSGIGVFGIIGGFTNPTMGGIGKLDPVTNGILSIVGSFIALGCAILFSMILFKERVSEKKLLNKLFDSILFYSKYSLFVDEKELMQMKKELKQLNKDFVTKDFEKEITKNEKLIQKALKYTQKINNIEEKETISKEKIMRLGKRLIEKNKTIEASKLIAKYNQIDNSEKINELNNLAIETRNKINFAELKNISSELSKNIFDRMGQIKNIDKDLILNLKPNIWNVFNSMLINYGQLENHVDFKIDDLVNEKKEIYIKNKSNKKLIQA
ncbi:glucose PTS transporter subunit IIA [Mesoplasma coleopterae]|uniref:glucose PTS transporter subunit IIA n=1 Tax=Mesoplasma coleopterae TaxID=324078 RepID=UPI0013DF9DAC|nr:PTS glucose transporter subunit IIABC [Mesoplasma coleopterae]